MTQSENENDHFDLDHFDQHFWQVYLLLYAIGIVFGRALWIRQM